MNETEPELASGLIVNRRTAEKQLWLNGYLIGASSLSLPPQAQERWLREAFGQLSAKDIVTVAVGTQRLEERLNEERTK